MTDLVEWLLARITEDEASARSHSDDRIATSGGSWSCECGWDIAGDYPSGRLLRECTAKRRLIEFVLLQQAGASRSATEIQAAVVVFGVLTRLAQPYKDQPGWQQDWNIA